MFSIIGVIHKMCSVYTSYYVSVYGDDSLYGVYVIGLIGLYIG